MAKNSAELHLFLCSSPVVHKQQHGNTFHCNLFRSPLNCGHRSPLQCGHALWILSKLSRARHFDFCVDGRGEGFTLNGFQYCLIQMVVNLIAHSALARYEQKFACHIVFDYCVMERDEIEQDASESCQKRELFTAATGPAGTVCLDWLCRRTSTSGVLSFQRDVHQRM